MAPAPTKEAYVAAIEPGHDALVEGDEPYVSVDFGGFRQYGKPSS